MKVLRMFLEITATSVSLASIIFMGLVFWTEVHGHGITYIEPNLYMAFTELLVTVFGGGLVLGKFIKLIQSVEPESSRSYVESVGEEA